VIKSQNNNFKNNIYNKEGKLVLAEGNFDNTHISIERAPKKLKMSLQIGSHLIWVMLITLTSLHPSHT